MFVSLIILFTASAAFSQVKFVGDDLSHYHQEQGIVNCTHEPVFDPEIHENLPLMTDGFSVSFIWPLSTPPDEGCNIVNYVDLNSTSAVTDYMGNPWSYNGHRGTDISLHDFRQMDRFVSIYAAAAGTVVQIRFNNFDRNTGWDNSPANLVLIRHNDGTYAYYYHLMKNSVTVKLGEYVPQGRLIGYVGSSGNSTDAHLHFEPGFFTGDTWTRRDPWHGTNNSLESLWEDQYQYVGNDPFKFMDMGVYVNASVGGPIETNTTSAKLKERIIDPVTVSGYEPRVGVWLQYQSANTTAVTFEIRKPSGTLFKSTTYTPGPSDQYGWAYWVPTFDVGIEETGNWYARIVRSGVELGRKYFNVQLLTSTRPRLWPEAAQCFRKSLLVQKDTLRVRPPRVNMQYELLNAPAGVSITNDSIINIGAFDNIWRVREFKVIASIGGNATLRDTMIYKLIDTTKNQILGNGVCSVELTGMIEGFWNGTDMVEDTVTVQVRAPLYPYNLVDQTKVYLNKNGYAIANFLTASPGLSYYLVVKHRNSIETWSKNTVQFPNGFPLQYDFTTSITKAYGNNLKLKSGQYCFYSGDVNQDGTVNLADVSAVYNASTVYTFGYYPTDLTGNNFINLADITIVYNNATTFVSKETP